MKVVSIVGARPQFIKVKPVLEGFKKSGDRHVLVHTGQHYDYEMSQLFFQQLRIPRPRYDLDVGPDTPCRQTAKMLVGIEKILLKEKPDAVLVYGDTTSTLAGSLAAVKLGRPVAHIEAGLRSYRTDMPEEINRVLTDRVAAFLFCPTATAVRNLRKEGITRGVHTVGDVMYDLFVTQISRIGKDRLSAFRVQPKGYYFLTVHRQENTDRPPNLRNILLALRQVPGPVIFPVHPRTRKALKALGELRPGRRHNIRFIEPVGYLDTLALLKYARKVLTDSGGLQKEAYFLKVPCITLRRETEWTETLKGGRNRLVGTDRAAILKAVRAPDPGRAFPPCFGNGKSVPKIIGILKRSLSSKRSTNH